MFQMTGGTKAVTREEMRAFKKVWAEFANPRTGFLERNRFVPFFAVSAFAPSRTQVELKRIVSAAQRHLRSADIPRGIQRPKYSEDLHGRGRL